MRQALIFLMALMLAGAAHAQLYKWVDKDGKVRYGDSPPPGAKTSALKAPQGGAAAAATPAAAKDAAKDAAKGPLTPAEQAQEFRKRQEETKKSAEKSEREQQAKSERNEGCERTREYLRTLESGQRIARSNPSGERYYLDDNQVAQEIAKAQQSVRQACK